MNKISPEKPILFFLYGFPGSGKTHFARQLADDLLAAHVQSDKIRNELFDKPRHDSQENAIVKQLMDYMTGEFLQSGMSVIYDASASRAPERRLIRDLAIKNKALPQLVWLQIDKDSAFARLDQRDRRKIDDKYAVSYSRSSFEDLIRNMQNPIEKEDYIVISGKHTFSTQRSAIIKRLYELGLIRLETISSGVVKPGLVNLVPNMAAGRVDMTRRNISVR